MPTVPITLWLGFLQQGEPPFPAESETQHDPRGAATHRQTGNALPHGHTSTAGQDRDSLTGHTNIHLSRSVKLLHFWPHFFSRRLKKWVWVFLRWKTQKTDLEDRPKVAEELHICCITSHQAMMPPPNQTSSRHSQKHFLLRSFAWDSRPPDSKIAELLSPESLFSAVCTHPSARSTPRASHKRGLYNSLAKQCLNHASSAGEGGKGYRPWETRRSPKKGSAPQSCSFLLWLRWGKTNECTVQTYPNHCHRFQHKSSPHRSPQRNTCKACP